MDAHPPATDLFPAIEPFDQGQLDVGDGHRIYWEQAGRPDGVPVVYLHGGPGAGCAGVHRRFFDPGHYRIVLLDQRGAGRSRPYAGTAHNTTPHLVADLERLRRHLGIDRWLVFGGSWGATLALAYGQAHPESCTGFVLRGVFLGRRAEVDWFLHGMGRFFPEVRERFLGFLPAEERADPFPAYHRRLMDPDPAIHGPAASAWYHYENACSRLVPPPGSLRPTSGVGTPPLALARLEAHYFHHDLFLAADQILSGMDRIRALPAVIVQGRYDLVCPPESAMALAAAWPGAELVMVPNAGHSALEPGIRAALVEATERFKRPGA